MNACIKQTSFSLIRLEASPELRIFLYSAYVESLFAENRSTFQSAQSASDDDNVIFTHASPVF